MPLTLKQVMHKTTDLRKRNAQFVTLQKLQAGHWRSGPDKGLAYVAAQTFSTQAMRPDGTIVPVTPNLYVTAITFIDRQLHVKCSCSCADFTYRYEYALNQKQAADIEYSNGEPPVITNPRLVPRSCKHIVALYDRIKDKLPS